MDFVVRRDSGASSTLETVAATPSPTTTSMVCRTALRALRRAATGSNLTSIAAALPRLSRASHDPRAFREEMATAERRWCGWQASEGGNLALRRRGDPPRLRTRRVCPGRGHPQRLRTGPVPDLRRLAARHCPWLPWAERLLSRCSSWRRSCWPPRWSWFSSPTSNSGTAMGDWAWSPPSWPASR